MRKGAVAVLRVFTARCATGRNPARRLFSGLARPEAGGIKFLESRTVLIVPAMHGGLGRSN